MSVSIFFCYAHEDEALLNKLKTHLRPLQRQKLIDLWYDRDISAGTKWEEEINKHLNEAQIILLLVSPDFMDSDYCYGTEMQQALERDRRGEARVLPIIVRPVYWQGILGKFQALPTDAKPVVDRYWHTLDEALYDVVEGIRKIVEQFNPQHVSPSEVLLSQAMKGESGAGSHPIWSSQLATPLHSLQQEVVPLLSTLTGHSSIVSSVAFSPDGHTLASGSFDQTIKLWNLATGEELCTFKEHTNYVTSVAFSPNGQTLASGSWDKTIKLWDVASGKQLRTHKRHKTVVASVAFSPNGKTLACGSWDHTIKLWNLASGKQLRTLTGHTSEVSSVAFSPNGKTLASGSWDKTIKLWNLATGQELRTLTEHTSEVTSVAFSPDGQTLASGSWDKTIKIWEIKK